MQRTYTRILYLCSLLLVLSSSILRLEAQQDPMFTQYMFNTLAYNPAYAGSKEYLSSNVLYRSQWYGWNNRGNGLHPDLTTGGAPVTQTFTIHSPLNERIGVGFSVVNDKIGVTESTVANFSYAYRIPFIEGKLALAVQGGVLNFRADYADLIALDPLLDDPAFMDLNPNIWRPNFGFGLYYHSDHFYLGISVPHLLESNLRTRRANEPLNGTNIHRTYQHFYFAMGGAVPIKNNPDFVFKPSLLVKSVGILNELSRQGNNTQVIGAPNEFDLDLSMLLYQSFWIGASFRSSFEVFIEQTSSTDSADIWFGYLMKNGLTIALAYDFSLTKVQDYSVGSFEVSLGYDLNFRDSDSVNSPRYF